MVASKQGLKNRIHSIDSTKKITKVMQLIASTELTRLRKKMEHNEEYAQAMADLLAFVPEIKAQADDLPDCYIAISSDMGLCGAYNANIFRLLQESYQPTDYLMVVGSRGLTWATNRHFNLASQETNLNEDDAYLKLAHMMDVALDLFMSGRVKSVRILYTHYKNSLSFEARADQVLPIAPKEKKVSLHAQMEFEPSKAQMGELVLPMALKSILFSHYLESKVSEQASRRTAMETATDSANELRENLMLEYNQARQASITEEIIEIVGGANALQ